jgi:hypothetical protein
MAGEIGFSCNRESETMMKHSHIFSWAGRCLVVAKEQDRPLLLSLHRGKSCSSCPALRPSATAKGSGCFRGHDSCQAVGHSL